MSTASNMSTALKMLDSIVTVLFAFGILAAFVAWLTIMPTIGLLYCFGLMP